MKRNWRGVVMFLAALVCATSALVAAGLSEDAADSTSQHVMAHRIGR